MKRLTDAENIHELIKANPAILDRVRDFCCDAFGPLWCNIDEILHDAPTGADWNIGYPGDYINLGDDRGAILDYFCNILCDYSVFTCGNEIAQERINKARRYLDVIDLADYDRITVHDKDYQYMDNFVDDLINRFTGEILQYCKSEVDYWRDDDVCIDYCLEMEYLTDILVKDDNTLVDVDTIQAVFKNQGLYWDVDTIIDFIDRVENAEA